jgi:hypothetical protein
MAPASSLQGAIYCMIATAIIAEAERQNLAQVLKEIAPSPRALSALAVRADLSRRVIGRAASGQAINASAYLRLCGLLGLDPVNGDKHEPREIGDVQWWFFGWGVKGARLLRKTSVRQAARISGVCNATICRAEQGRPISAESYLALCSFIGAHPHHFTGNSQCNSLKTLAVAAE